MPSVNDVRDADPGWFESQEITINAFIDKIASCIEHSEWETLAVVLDARQAFLQQLYAADVPDRYKAQLKVLAESILQQDVVFLSLVEEQKRAIMKQQMALDLGRRAVNAYNGH